MSKELQPAEIGKRVFDSGAIAERPQSGPDLEVDQRRRME